MAQNDQPVPRLQQSRQVWIETCGRPDIPYELAPVDFWVVTIELHREILAYLHTKEMIANLHDQRIEDYMIVYFG